ncbi:MAG: Rrf2 family transcriptional regulator [Clostridiales bacterium]|jgi:Rrf2 family protein|nr:Rrf2 family transcriptional regulator [Clostridiales bacterium]
MKISTKGRYAIRLMLDLSDYNKDEYVSLKEVSARQDISLKYLEQIVSLLSRKGLLKSSRGAQGGYKLARRADEYTIGEILRITEGELAPTACLIGDENTCPRCDTCLTLDFWKGLYAVINEYVDNYTLEDMKKTKRNKMKNSDS